MMSNKEGVGYLKEVGFQTHDTFHKIVNILIRGWNYARNLHSFPW